MTAPGNLICSKCGFSNVPGDQFCGSCGSFLEWEGVAAPASDAAPAPAPGGYPISDVPVVGPPPGQGSAAGSQAPPPVSAPPVTPPAASATSSATLIRCPACGIANAAGRTFCQS